uniref:Transmembrane protein n=1 Tax=Heterorhabditis bacteriophora TaxID=37862 RepID=A0A1I7X3F6_HETBA
MTTVDAALLSSFSKYKSPIELGCNMEWKRVLNRDCNNTLLKIKSQDNLIRLLLNVHFLLELVTSFPFAVTIFQPQLRQMFVPVFLNCWLAKGALQAMMEVKQWRLLAIFTKYLARKPSTNVQLDIGFINFVTETSLEDEDGRGHSLVVDDGQLRAIA